VRSHGRAALLEDSGAARLPLLRQELDELWDEAQDVYVKALADGAAKAVVDRLAAQMARLVELDRALRLEEAAIVDAPYRIDRVRGQIEDTIEKRLAAAAPDYAGALQLLRESPPPAASGGAGAPTTGMVSAAAESLTPEQMISRLETTLPMLQARVPTRAADVYRRMGECATNLG
jgi:hypothetical protein